MANYFYFTGYWYIASGYLSDIIQLLDKFEAVEGWRFRDFANCWREMSFSLIYRFVSLVEIINIVTRLLALTKAS